MKQSNLKENLLVIDEIEIRPNLLLHKYYSQRSGEASSGKTPDAVAAEGAVDGTVEVSLLAGDAGSEAGCYAGPGPLIEREVATQSCDWRVSRNSCLDRESHLSPA